MSALAQFAEAIHKAQADRDAKILAVLAEALGCENTMEAVRDASPGRIQRHAHIDDAQTFYLDQVQLCYASAVTSSQDIVDGVVTVKGSYYFTDYRK